MSDYLWDKTGEADPEIEQLETLLGSLSYQPKPLVLPETVVRETRTRQRFLQGLAIAASLLLISLAGWFLVAQRRNTSSVAQTPSKVSATSVQAAEIKEKPLPADGLKEKTEQAVEKDLQPILAQQPRHRTMTRATFEKRRIKTEKDFSPATSQQDETARANTSLSQQELAEAERGKEQLMLALQVASAKLNHAQRKVQTAPNSEKISKPESKPDNQLR